MGTLTNQQLSYALAGMQLGAENKGTPTPEQLAQKIPQYQPLWEKYLNAKTEQLQKGIQAFRSYDIHGELNTLWVKLAKGLPYPKNKTFDSLMSFALTAYKNEDNEKALLMFNVIASLYPKSYRVYVFYGELLEKIKGAEEALNFYKFITGIFQEPELCFVAGECAMRHQKYDNAKNYLIQAYQLYQQRPRTNDGTDLRDGIQELLLDIAKICG